MNRSRENWMVLVLLLLGLGLTPLLAGPAAAIETLSEAEMREVRGGDEEWECPDAVQCSETTANYNAVLQICSAYFSLGETVPCTEVTVGKSNCDQDVVQNDCWQWGTALPVTEEWCDEFETHKSSFSLLPPAGERVDICLSYD